MPSRPMPLYPKAIANALFEVTLPGAAGPGPREGDRTAGR